MNKYDSYIVAGLGILIGLIASMFNIYFAYAICGIMLILGLILSDYQRSTYILGAFSVVDFIFRNYIITFASIWDELLLILLVLLWGYKWIVYKRKDYFKQSPLDLPIIIFISTMFFILVVNYSDFRISLEGFRAIVQYILWFFVVLQLLKDEKGARNLCFVFVFIASLMAIHGVYQYVIGVEMPSGWVDQGEAGVRTRVYSILTSPNIMGSLMTLAAPICMSFVFACKNKYAKYFFGICTLFMMAALMFTFSRGAWMGFAVAVMVYVFAKDKRMFIPVVILGLLIIAFIPSVGNRISYMLSYEYIESSLRGGRLIRWFMGLQILETSPLIGIGLGQFGGAVAMNNNLTRVIGVDVVKTFYMDNYYLKTAVESGLLGLCSLIILMYQVIICSVRTIKITKDNYYKQLEIGMLAGLCGVIVHNCVENVFEVPLMTSCFWLLAACMMHLWYLNYYKDTVEL